MERVVDAVTMAVEYEIIYYISGNLNCDIKSGYKSTPTYTL